MTWWCGFFVFLEPKTKLLQQSNRTERQTDGRRDGHLTKLTVNKMLKYCCMQVNTNWQSVSQCGSLQTVTLSVTLTASNRKKVRAYMCVNNSYTDTLFWTFTQHINVLTLTNILNPAEPKQNRTRKRSRRELEENYKRNTKELEG